MEIYNYCVVYNGPTYKTSFFSTKAGIFLDIIKLFTGFPCSWHPVQNIVYKTIIWLQMTTEQKGKHN